MINRLQAALISILIILVASALIYTEFKNQKRLNTLEFEDVEVNFVTTQIDGQEVVDIDVLSYTDITYMDLSLLIDNIGDKDLVIRNPILEIHLEDTTIFEKNLEDIHLSDDETRSIDLIDLSFESEKVNEALKGKTKNLDEAVRFSGVLSSGYNFSIQNIELYDYRLLTSFEGKVLLREIFGGKTQEEAASDILGLKQSI